MQNLKLLDVNVKHYILGDVNIDLFGGGVGWNRKYILDGPNEIGKFYKELSPGFRKYTNICSTYGVKQLVHCLTRTTCNTFFFYLGFLSQRFTNYRTAGEGGGLFFNSSLPLPPALQTLRH